MIGSVLAGHRILRQVGRGGMGVVYEAVDEALGRTVALKVVAPLRAGEPGFRERFITESRLAASIDHPNVLPVSRPANVLVAVGDHAYLTDFGVVKALDETSGQTRASARSRSSSAMRSLSSAI